jgi:hypothetical protein
MSGWTQGCYPNYDILEIGFGGCDSNFNCAAADAAMGSRTIYVAPTAELCQSGGPIAYAPSGPSNCNSLGYGKNIGAYFTADWFEDYGSYRLSCEADDNHYSPIENLDGGTLSIDIDVGTVGYHYDSQVCTRPMCDSNSDCGTNGWLGNEYCNNGDVWDTYRTWTCNNPGTASAACSSSDNGQLKEACDFGCGSAACLPDPCTDVTCDPYCNGYTYYSGGSCSLGQCSYSSSEVNSTSCGYCLDSDGGVDYFTKGNVTGLGSNQQIFTTHDYCKDSTTVYEGYCCSDQSHVNGIYHQCEYGCIDGACLSADPCLSVTCDPYCDGFTYYSGGSCSLGQCSYSNTEANSASCTPDFTMNPATRFSYPLVTLVNEKANASFALKNQGKADANASISFYDMTLRRQRNFGNNEVHSMELDGKYYSVRMQKNELQRVKLTIEGESKDVYPHQVEKFGDIYATADSFSITATGGSALVTIAKANVIITPLTNVPAGSTVTIDLNWTPTQTGNRRVNLFANTTGDFNLLDNYAGGYYIDVKGTECSSASDCGTNGWVGNDYCNGTEIWGTYRTWTCNNPGTASASCSHADAVQMKQECAEACANNTCVSVACWSDRDCGNDSVSGDKFCQGSDIMQMLTKYECRNSGTGSSYCEQVEEALLVKECRHRCHMGVCVEPAVKCNVNSDCGDNGAVAEYCSGNDVWQSYRTWACMNPGANNAYCRYSDAAQLVQVCGSGCVNGKCITTECSSDSDCGEDGWVKSPYCNENDVYQKYRTWNCLNPGTASSSCEYADSSQLKESCNSCSGGLCVEGNEQSDDIEISNFIRQTRTPRAGSTVTLAFTIQNNGNSPVGNLQWTLDTGAGTTIISSVGELGAGEKQIIMRQVVYPSAGTYNASAAVDPDNKIAESDEENNEANVSVVVS